MMKLKNLQIVMGKVILFVFLSFAFTLWTESEAFADWKMAEPSFVTPEEAHKFFRNKQALKTNVCKNKAKSSSTKSTPEIKELARSLKNDPDLIYKYVYDKIEYIPMFGSRKGAEGTLLDGKGNDFDQCSLMIALLREAGYTANFVYGVIGLTVEQSLEWFDLENNGSIFYILGHANIPHTLNGNILDVSHVWVKVNIDGTDYAFDPSFKNYTYTSAIDLASAMGYDHDTFLSEALEGADITDDYIRNVNRANIRSSLENYASKLIEYIRNNYSAPTLDDIIGGKKINPVQTQIRQTSLPNQVSITEEWTEIPDEYKAKLRIELPGLDLTLPSHEIYGNRLTFFYDDFNQATLRLDGAVLGVGTPANTGWCQLVTFSIDEPYPGDNGTICDETQTMNICPSSGSYFILNDWGGFGNKTIEKHRKIQKQYIHDNLDKNSEPVIGEALAIICYSWLAQARQFADMTARINNSVVVSHHRLGLLDQGFTGEGVSIDIPVDLAGYASKEYDRDIERAAFFHDGGNGSALEWGVIEQTQPFSAISTIKLIDIANSDSYKLFDVTSSNYPVIKPQLKNYSESLFSDIDWYLDAGCRFILPENGDFGEGLWSGIGYFQFCDNSVSYKITGGLNGGYSTDTTPLDTEEPANSGETGEQDGEHEESPEPIDLVTGDYLYDHTDLSVGNGQYPFALRFNRSYNSSSGLNNGSLGLGWTHNFNINLDVDSNGFQGMGQDSPIDAAAAIAQIYICSDMLLGETKEGIIISSVAQRWFMEQLIDNRVTVNSGGKNTRFIKLPDNTYNPPQGFVATLTKEADGTYLVKTKSGIILDFNTDGKLETWKDTNNNTVTFFYNGGKLQSISNNLGKSLTFTYNGEHIGQITDGTRTVGYKYDAVGNLILVSGADGKDTKFGYDSDGRLISIYYPSNPTIPFVTNTYDSLGRVSEQRDAKGNSYLYYFTGYRAEEVTPLGHSNIWYFNEQGKTIRKRDPLGNETGYVYDSNNRLIQLTLPSDITWLYDYDDQGNVTKITDPVNKQQIMAYDDNSNLISSTNELKKKTSYAYDTKRNITRITYPDNIHTDFSYNSKGQVATITDPSGEITDFSYDTQGNLVSVKNPEGDFFVYTYDTLGRAISKTDARKKTTNYQYDALNRVIRTTDALKGKVNTTYELAGLSSLTDQKSNATTFQYDAANHLTGIIDPLENTEIFSYDKNGNLDSHTDANKNTINYTYDKLNRLSTIRYPDNTRVSLSYDALGRLRQMTDNTGTSVYVYDDLGRLTSYTNGHGLSLAYTYDAAGNLSSLTYPGNKKVSYTYDDQNRLISLTDWSGRKTSFSYDQRGLLSLTTLPNNTTVRYEYDNAGRIVGLRNLKGNGDVIASYAYTLDGNGNIISETSEQPLDPAMNAEAIKYTYGLDIRLQKAGNVSFGYDNNGNIIKKGNTAYEYDYENRLKKVISPEGSWEYEYDGLGRRLVRKHNNEERRFLSDPRGMTQMLAEYDGNGDLIACYIYGLGLVYKLDATDTPYYYHYNFTGHTVAMSDVDGNIVNSYAYTPFGILTNHEENVSNPFRYVGKFGVIDDENGLLYMRARYYDSEIGRFIVKDPIGFDGGVNLYGYVHNNPVNLIDPFGLLTFQLGGSANAGAGAGGTIGSGIVVGLSWENGLQLGTYTVIGGGGQGGVVYSGVVDITGSLNTDINQLSGLATTSGGSGGEGFCIGGEMNIPINSNASPSFTVSPGLGGGLTPIEVHGFVTYTEVQEIDWRNEIIQASKWWRNNVFQWWDNESK